MLRTPKFLFTTPFIASVLLLLAPFSLFAICSPDSFHDCMDQRDFEAVQEFVNSKRTIFLAEKLDCLTIAGNVKIDALNTNVWLCNLDVFGGTVQDGTGLQTGHVTFESEVNLMINYKRKDGRSWAKSRLQFDNEWGVFESLKTCDNDPNGLFGSGEFGAIDLKWAYWGWRVFETCDENFEINLIVGRNKLYKIFNSRIEFNATADGATIEFNRYFEPDWIIYNTTCFFIVDERTNHWAWATEFGSDDFFEKKVDFTYSFIDWALNGENRCGTENPLGALFRVSQWGAAYNFEKDSIFKSEARLYGAFLMNHSAQPIEQFGVNYGIQNKAFYAGFIYGGEVRKEGDWMFDINYQWVQAMAIPSLDVFGIARGVEFRNAPSINGYGKANYKGFHMECLFALTDRCQIDATFDMSWTLNQNIGLVKFDDITKAFNPSPLGTGNLRYNKFEIDFIVNF